MTQPAGSAAMLACTEARSADALLPLVYDELRRLAAAQLSRERRAQRLEATALVHEAYLRFAGGEPENGWDGRRHFFCAAAEAMRRILIERARRARALKNGGGWQRNDLTLGHLAIHASPERALLINDLLEKLGEEDSVAADVAKLRIFVGLTPSEAGEVLDVSRATSYRKWTFARAWLIAEMDDYGD
ncbi:MAG: ECF-type sigma factor [Pirellulaceae bacterium]